jgi:hypothetical protein
VRVSAILTNDEMSEHSTTPDLVGQNARPVGRTGHVWLRRAAVLSWVDGVLPRLTIYHDIDRARAAAKRLAEERR